jgi:hypothetical protein
MTLTKSTGILLSGAIVLVAFAASAQAGMLSGHAAAYMGISGTVPFNNGVGLNGTIDYAVFTESDFNANFGGLGYVPSGPLVYTYQVFVTGNLGVSAEVVGVSNPADTIGTFDIGDIDATTAAFTPNARWSFSPEIATGESSWGLAFSSPNLPIVGAALTIDGGTQALVAGLPTPGTVGIRVPEPSTVVLCVLGAGAIVVGATRRKRA